MPRGIYLTTSGYYRFSSPKTLRGKYVHREVVEKLIAETPPPVVKLLPWPYEVHHMDYDKRHNCSYNLLLMSCDFHAALTAAGRTRTTSGTFTPKWASVPEWATSTIQDIVDDEVPF